jgi:hypothetical protein
MNSTPRIIYFKCLKMCGVREKTTMRSISKTLAVTFLAGLMASSTGTIRADDRPAQSVKQADDGSIKLGAADAQINGPNAKLVGGDEKNIIWWTNTDTSLRWTASVLKPGKYRVELNYSIIGSNNGSEMGITVGDQSVKATPKAGNGLDDYKIGNAGEITIGKTGNLQVVMKPLLAHHEFVINIRSVALVPADSSTPPLDITGRAIEQSDDGSFNLTAADAEIDGMNAQLQQPDGGGEKNIGRWNDLGTVIAWGINVQKPGKYRVELNYALNPPSEGCKVAIEVGDQKVLTRPKSTKDWFDFRTGRAGEITITKTGEIKVVMRAISRRYWVLAVRSVTLLPAETPTNAIDISDKPVKQSADGSLKLAATDAEIDGNTFKLEGGDIKYIVWWNTGEDFIRWPIKIDKPDTFSVRLTYSLANKNSQIETVVGGQKLINTITPGRGLDDVKTEKLGEVTLEKLDNFDVVMRSTSTTEGSNIVMYLRSVSLVPVHKK